MKTDPYYQQRRCILMTSFWQYKVYADIRRGSLEKGRRATVGVIKKVDFQGFWAIRLRQLRKLGQHYYIVLFSPLSSFH